MNEDQNGMDERKIRILTNEYTILRTEIKTYSILEIIFVCISILTFTILFVLASISNQYILLLGRIIISTQVLTTALSLIVEYRLSKKIEITKL